MCRYICHCRHIHCVRAPQGCFVLGWPCMKHNDPAEFNFTTGALKSRDADWSVVRKKLRRVIESINKKGLTASNSKALPIYLRNTLARLAAGARHDVPISMTWFQIQQGEIPKPPEKWRSTKFEIECAQLRQFFDHEIEIPPVSQRMVAVEPADPRLGRESSMLGMTLGFASNSDTLVATQSDRELSQISSDMTIFPEEGTDELARKNDLQALKPIERPPAWRPSAPEVSLLLKTIILEDESPPTSPTFSFDSEDLEKPNPFRQKERHQTFYALEENKSRTIFGSVGCLSQFAQSAIILDQLVEANPLSRVTEADEVSQYGGSNDGSFEMRSDSTATSSRYSYSELAERQYLDPMFDPSHLRSTPDSRYGRYLTVYDGPRHTPTSIGPPPLTGFGGDTVHNSFADDDDDDSDSGSDSADIRYMQQLSRRNFNRTPPAGFERRRPRAAGRRVVPQRPRVADDITDVFLQLAEEAM